MTDLSGIVGEPDLLFAPTLGPAEPVKSGVQNPLSQMVRARKLQRSSDAPRATRLLTVLPGMSTPSTLTTSGPFGPAGLRQVEPSGMLTLLRA